jgi:DNA repair exonuclease SbcCD ATPase subunit
MSLPDDVGKRVAILHSEYLASKEVCRTHRKALRKSKARAATMAKAQKVVQVVAASMQQHAHDRIASVVSRCLELVFDDPYEFRIRFEQKRGRTEAKLVFTRNGEDVSPMAASGGGVVDVAAFALRLSALLLSKPAPRLFLALDEPFRFVSQDHRERVSHMLTILSKELGVQFLIITHMQELQVGKVIKL